MNDDNIVLRTVYIPLDIDGRLREVAFTRGVSESDLIRELVKLGLDACKPTIADRVSARAKQKKSK